MITKWVLSLLKKKSLGAKELDKQVQFAALYGVLACHGFTGGTLLLWRVGTKIMRESAAARGKVQHGG